MSDGELVFKPGEIYKELEISILEDNKKEDNKTLTVMLNKPDSNSVEVALSGLTKVDITIIDSGEFTTNNDQKGVIEDAFEKFSCDFNSVGTSFFLYHPKLCKYTSSV